MPPAFPRCRPFTAPYDRAELLVDGLLHAAGLAFALFGLVFLTEKAQVLPLSGPRPSGFMASGWCQCSQCQQHTTFGRTSQPS